MLRRRLLSNKKEKNYILTTYNGSGNIKILGDAFNISQIESIFVDGNEIPTARNYNFTTGGNHSVIFNMIPNSFSCSHMFDTCEKLTAFDLSHFDMSKITELSAMFFKCNGLVNIKFENLNWENVTKMNSFCSECSKLKTVSFLNLLSKKIVNMDWAFNWTSLESCDMSGLDVSKVTSMKSMFDNCWYLTSLKIMSSVNSLQNRDRMFYLVFTKGTFYCNKNYNYSKLKIPSRWKEVRL